MVLDRKKVACSLRLGGDFLPQVEEWRRIFGALVTSEGKKEHKIDRRIGEAATVMRSISVPSLTYGDELWVITIGRNEFPQQGGGVLP